MDHLVANPIIGIIQARYTSQRLPGKVLRLLVEDKTVLETLILRLNSTSIQWWIATGNSPDHDPIAKIGEKMGLPVYRGSEENVLSRFKDIVLITKAKWVVRVTADNPFTSGNTVDYLMSLLPELPTGISLVSGGGPKSRYPLGFIPEIVKSDAILRISDMPGVEKTHHASHVTSGIEPDESISLGAVIGPDRSRWRWTIDTHDDLAMAKAAFAAFGDKWQAIDYIEMVRILDKNPHIPRMNASTRQKRLEEG